MLCAIGSFDQPSDIRRRFHSDRLLASVIARPTLSIPRLVPPTHIPFRVFIHPIIFYPASFQFRLQLATCDL